MLGPVVLVVAVVQEWFPIASGLEVDCLETVDWRFILDPWLFQRLFILSEKLTRFEKDARVSVSPRDFTELFLRMLFSGLRVASKVVLLFMDLYGRDLVGSKLDVLLLRRCFGRRLA